jgi:hypothetical protein
MLFCMYFFGEIFPLFLLFWVHKSNLGEYKSTGIFGRIRRGDNRINSSQQKRENILDDSFDQFSMSEEDHRLKMSKITDMTNSLKNPDATSQGHFFSMLPKRS